MIMFVLTYAIGRIDFLDLACVFNHSSRVYKIQQKPQGAKSDHTLHVLCSIDGYPRLLLYLAKFTHPQ